MSYKSTDKRAVKPVDGDFNVIYACQSCGFPVLTKGETCVACQACRSTGHVPVGQCRCFTVDKRSSQGQGWFSMTLAQAVEAALQSTMRDEINRAMYGDPDRTRCEACGSMFLTATGVVTPGFSCCAECWREQVPYHPNSRCAPGEQVVKLTCTICGTEVYMNEAYLAGVPRPFVCVECA